MKIPHPKAASLAATLLLLLSALLSSTIETTAQVKAMKAGERLSATERELLDEMNFARTRPAEYAALLEKLKPFYKGNVYAGPDGKSLTTQEGWKAVEEAIQFLRALKPLQPLGVSDGMCSGASELVKDQARTGTTGHKGSDGSFCEQRVTRYGSWVSPIGENLSYGSHSARERVIQLIIDDGFSNRGHRNRILDPGFKVAGVSCGNHPSESTICVVTIAGGFTDKPAASGNQKSTPAKPLPAGSTRY